MKLIENLKSNAKRLKSQIYVIYCAARHPGTPWHAKLVIFLVVAYALSPIDLIHDFIPILGYLDDLIILPLGIALALRLIPKDVTNECITKASEFQGQSGKNWKAAIAIIIIWIVAIIILGKWLWTLALTFHK